MKMTKELLPVAIEYLANYLCEEFDRDRDTALEEITDDLHEVGVAHTTLSDEELPVQVFVDIPNMRITRTVIEDEFLNFYRVWEVEQCEDVWDFLNRLRDYGWDEYIAFDNYQDTNLYIDDIYNSASSYDCLPLYVKEVS